MEQISKTIPYSISLQILFEEIEGTDVPEGSISRRGLVDFFLVTQYICAL